MELADELKRGAPTEFATIRELVTAIIIHASPSRPGGTGTKANAEDDRSVRIDIKGRLAALCGRGLLGVHSRYGLHTRAVTVYRDTLTRGFSDFVASMTAPVASGWSGCRVGFTPTGKRRLFTAHTRSGFSTLIRRINTRSSVSICGRPPNGRDFQRQ